MEWDIKEFDLSGTRLITNRTPGVSSVNVCVVMNVGSLDELPAHKRGTVHFFEHIPFEGTENYPGSTHIHAAAIGGEIGAHTDFESTKFSLVVPQSNWKAGVNLIADVVQNATMDAKKIASEALTIANEIREKPFRNPGFALAMRLHDHLYRDARLYSGLGTRDSVLSMRREDLMAVRDQFYVRENCRIIVSGDLEHEDVRQEIGDTFKSLPHGSPTVREPLTVKPGYDFQRMSEYNDIMNYITFPLSSGEWGLRNTILTGLIQGYFNHISGPAMIDMRHVNSMVYGIDADQNWTRALGHLSVGCISAPDESERYVQKIIEHARNLVTGNFDEGFFSVVQNIICNNDEKFFTDAKYPSSDNILFWDDRDGRLIPPDEFLTIGRSLTRDDFISHARQIMAEKPAFFAYGNVDEVVSEGRFNELVRPLTEVASALHNSKLVPKS